MSESGKPCSYHSSLANGMRLYGPKHPCFTVYDVAPAERPVESAGPAVP